MWINRLTVLVAFTALAVAAPALAAEEARSVPAFSAVKFAGAGEMDVTVGDRSSVRLEGDADLLRHVTTKVHGDTLEIREHTEHHWWTWSPFFSHHNERLVVHIVTPRLTALSLNGAAKATTTGLNGGDMAFSISGAGDLKAQGHVEKLALDIAGAGSAELRDLVEDEAIVTISGAGHAVVQPKQSLHASVSGVGAVHYIGNPPDVTSDIHGLGSVERE